MDETPDVSSAPSDAALSTLAGLGARLFEAEAEVIRAEAALKAAKAVRDEIATVQIPEAMDEAGGVTEFKTKDLAFTLKDELSVRPSVKNRPRVLQLLRSTGHAAKIKTVVSVPFNAGEDHQARELAQYAGSTGHKAKLDEKVEPSTLKKHVKDALANGEEIDLELFGVFQARRAVFTAGAPQEVFGD